MVYSDWLRRTVLSFELRIVRWSSPLGKVALLRRLHRGVTANIQVLQPKTHEAIGFRVKFLSPYFHLPVAVEKTQIGFIDNGGRFAPTAFRFFDWHSWAHFDGAICWLGEDTLTLSAGTTEVITGFEYQVSSAATAASNFGIRIAEGVEGHVRIEQRKKILRVKFEPGYWMLERQDRKYQVVAIYDHDLMALIVSLSSLGGGNQRIYASARQQLEGWIAFKLDSKSPERRTLELLRYVRDWGPLRMPPLFPALIAVLENLGTPNQEKIFFDFYADNFGVLDNRNGRLLAVSMLEAMATQKALGALQAIYDYSRNRKIRRQELKRIQQAINTVRQEVQAPVPAARTGND